MLTWRVLGLVILVFLPIFGKTIATPVGSEHYSVEEQELSEQTVIGLAGEKNTADGKPIYEWQLAVWPEDEQEADQHVMSDDVSAPVFEEQEIAYPVMTPQQDDDDDDQAQVVHNIPTWHQTTTTERPPVHGAPVWQPVETTKIPVTWQPVPTTKRPKPQELPVWHNPQEAGVVHVPVWQQTGSAVSVPIVPTVTVPVLTPPMPRPPPTQIFPDIHFDEAEAIADQEDNVDVANDHFLISGIPGIPSKPKPTKRPVPQVEVIEQYQVVNPNGTTEYKLVLSNGMTNYKKIYNKLLSTGKIVTVQEGYDSVPIPGDDPYSNEYQTQYYIADEFGHNVYKVEKHTRRPKFPNQLDYKEQGGHF